MLKQKIK